METTLQQHDFARVPATPTAEVASFFEALRGAHACFLDTVGRAQSLLEHDAGQLAHIASVQSRLTRSFLDAQRSILMHRAEIDAEVALVGLPERAQATEVVAASREQSFIEAERQLATLLDAWWVAEREEGRAALDDAFARSAMHHHIVSVETAGPVDWTAPQTFPAPTMPAAPRSSAIAPDLALTQTLAGLDSAGAGSLEDLFLTLAEALNEPAQAAAPISFDAPSADAKPVDLAPPAQLLAPSVVVENEEVARAEAFQEFWQAPQPPVETKRASTWVITQVVVPMAAVTAAVAIIMAWIG
ncbi:MAG: hypothetical protein NTX77_13405 [Actinobacteria bacterium]|nr:hypothetical protein [Actinomycetota bacterium]